MGDVALPKQDAGKRKAHNLSHSVPDVGVWLRFQLDPGLPWDTQSHREDVARTKDVVRARQIDIKCGLLADEILCAARLGTSTEAHQKLKVALTMHTERVVFYALSLCRCGG